MNENYNPIGLIRKLDKCGRIVLQKELLNIFLLDYPYCQIIEKKLRIRNNDNSKHLNLMLINKCNRLQIPKNAMAILNWEPLDELKITFFLNTKDDWYFELEKWG